MKSFICLVLLFSVTSLPFSASAAAGTDSVEFYDGVVTALQITKPELRALKLLELLKKSPAQVENIYPLLQQTLKKTDFTPAISKCALEILNENPHDLLINFLLFKAYSNFDIRSKKWQQLLINCQTDGLTPRQEQAVLILCEIMLQHFSSRELCEQNRDFLTALCDRFAGSKNSPRFNILFHGIALDIYRQLIWESDCTAYGCKRWDTLPNSDIKKRYIRTVDTMSKYENGIEYPVSLELLKIYNRHRLPQRIQYTGKFDGTTSIEVIETILNTAQLAKNSSIFDKYLDFEIKPGVPLRKIPYIALIYAESFNRFDMLKKLIPQAEFDVIQLTIQKKYPQAAAAAKKLLATGKITEPTTVRASIDALWHTQDTQLLRQIIDLLEKNSALLTPDNANSAAYSAAVFNIALDKAEKLARFALEKLPDSTAVLDTMAHIMYKKKDFVQADKFITSSMMLITPGEGCATIYLHAAEIELAHTANKLRAGKLLKRAKLAAIDNDYEFDRKRADELQEILNK